jgi:hypothetical protein
MVTVARCCKPQAIFKATIIHQSDLAGTPPGGWRRFFRFCRAEGCVILAACALAACGKPQAPQASEQVWRGERLAELLSSISNGDRLEIPPGIYRLCDTTLPGLESCVTETWIGKNAFGRSFGRWAADKRHVWHTACAALAKQSPKMACYFAGRKCQAAFLACHG